MINKAIRDNIPSHDLTSSWRTSMACFVLSRNGEESSTKFLSPDPDPDFLWTPGGLSLLACLSLLNLLASQDTFNIIGVTT